MHTQPWRERHFGVCGRVGKLVSLLLREPNFDLQEQELVVWNEAA